MQREILGATLCFVNPQKGIRALLRNLVVAIEKWLESARPGGMAQLAKRFRFDLPNSLSSHIERASHLFEGVFGPVSNTETEP